MQRSSSDVFEIIEKSAKNYIQNPEVFSEEYVPENLPGRKKQIEEVTLGLKYAVFGKPAPHMGIYGPTGSGKTAVLKYVLKEMDRYMQEKKDESLRYIFVPCKKTVTEARTLDFILHSLGVQKSFINQGVGACYLKVKEIIEQLGSTVIVVLDEVDKLRDPNSLLYNLSRPDLKSGYITVVYISNSLQFGEKLEASVASSLNPRMMYFPAYNAEQLQEILLERIKEAGITVPVEEGVVELCSALAAAQDGNARIAINLLRKTIDIAERCGAESVKIAYVWAAEEETDKDLIQESINGMAFHEKLAFLAAALCTEAAMRRGERHVNVGMVYDAYLLLCRSTGFSSLSQRRFRDIINKLESLDLVGTRVEYRGRYGKVRCISLGVKPELVIELVTKDPVFQDLNLEGVRSTVRENVGAPEK